MTLADWAMVVAIVFSVAVAASQGFFYEAFSLAGTVIGYLLASWEYFRVAGRLAAYTKTQWAANVAAFLLIFLGVVLLAGIIARLARWAMREVGLRWFDRLLGAVFGMARGVLLVSVTIVGVVTFAPGSRILAGSQLAPYFLVVARAATWLAPADVRAQFRQGLETLRRLAPPAGPAMRGQRPSQRAAMKA
jgi:membrane protein required for colicin V production